MKSKFKCACGTTTRYTDKDAQKLVTKNIPKANRGSRPNQKEIENWIFNYLDVPSAFYMDNKPCPFAAKAWRDKQVQVIMGDKSTVRQQVYTWDDSYQLVIVVFDPEDWTNADHWAERYNDRIVDKDLYVMVFEPGDEPPDDPTLDPEEYGQVVDYEYGMVLIQRRAELNKFSKFLESQNYYANCSDHFMKYVKRRLA